LLSAKDTSCDHTKAENSRWIYFCGSLGNCNCKCKYDDLCSIVSSNPLLGCCSLSAEYLKYSFNCIFTAGICFAFLNSCPITCFSLGSMETKRRKWQHAACAPSVAQHWSKSSDVFVPGTKTKTCDRAFRVAGPRGHALDQSCCKYSENYARDGELHLVWEIVKHTAAVLGFRSWSSQNLMMIDFIDRSLSRMRPRSKISGLGYDTLRQIYTNEERAYGCDLVFPLYVRTRTRLTLTWIINWAATDCISSSQQCHWCNSIRRTANAGHQWNQDDRSQNLGAIGVKIIMQTILGYKSESVGP